MGLEVLERMPRRGLPRLCWVLQRLQGLQMCRHLNLTSQQPWQVVQLAASSSAVSRLEAPLARQKRALVFFQIRT